jgi:RNA polymerase sigma-70 factor (ECF subfamily)
MSAFNDTDLPQATLERARSGDEAALAAVYRAFERPVFTLARRLVPQRAAAEDLAHDVFVDVLTRLHQYQGRGSFAGWVRSITVSRCLMHLRSPWQRGRRWIDSVADEALPSTGDEAVLATITAPGRDRADQVDLERALARLGGTARAVVWLHDVEGYTHAEIGELFGASASFSKSQLSRAHERLREWLQPEGVEASCMPVSNNC